MEISEVFKIAEKNLDDINSELGFAVKSREDNCIVFSGEKGIYRLVFDASNSIMAFECAYDTESQEPEFNTLSRSLFDPVSYNERDAKSLSNEIRDELTALFMSRKKVNLDKVKMPKAVS